jgi:hypothetical protein
MKIEFVYFYGLYNLDVDWNVGHSHSAGGRGASSAFACGVSPRHAFPAGVSNTRSNQLCFKRNNTFCLQTNNKGESEHSNTDDGKGADF